MNNMKSMNIGALSAYRTVQISITANIITMNYTLNECYAIHQDTKNIEMAKLYCWKPSTHFAQKNEIRYRIQSQLRHLFIFCVSGRHSTIAQMPLEWPSKFLIEFLFAYNATDMRNFLIWLDKIHWKNYCHAMENVQSEIETKHRITCVGCTCIYVHKPIRQQKLTNDWRSMLNHALELNMQIAIAYNNRLGTIDIFARIYFLIFSIVALIPLLCV